MPLLYDVVDAVYARERKKRRRRVVLLVIVLGLVVTGAFLWPRQRGVVAAMASELGMRRVELFSDEIRAAARESQVDPCLVAAIMYSESRGDVDAKSSAGALGLMQLAESSASDAAHRLGLSPPTEKELLSDAELNIRLGARHLAWLLEYRGDMDLEQVLICYNAGRTKFFRWIEAAGGYNAWRAVEMERLREGEPNTGALSYAIQTLAVRDDFARRGRVVD